MTDPLIWNAAIKAAAESLVECSVWCDSQERTDASWHNGVIDARKHHTKAILAIAKSAPDLRSVVDSVARAICKESCAFYGEPPCYQTGDWPNSQCNEPGCQSLAIAALGLESGE